MVPAEYPVEIDTGFFSMDSVTAVMQKNGADSSELRVQIVVDGEVVEETSTTAEYGVAQVSWTPGEEGKEKGRTPEVKIRIPARKR